MPRLIAAIIRHGDYHWRPETPSAHQPFPLTELGEQQAREAADALHRRLNREGWTLSPDMHSSRLLRAWQTARIIMNELSQHLPNRITLHSHAQLAERGLGSVANLTLREIEAVIEADPRIESLPDDWTTNSYFKLPLQGAESFMEAGERVASLICAEMKALAQKTDTDTLKLFVGHGAAFRHAAHHLGVLSLDEIPGLSMHHAQPVYLEYEPESKHWTHIGGEWKKRPPGHFVLD